MWCILYTNSISVLSQGAHSTQQIQPNSVESTAARQVHGEETVLAKPLNKVTQTVIQLGQNQWYSFGVLMGFSEAEISAICFDKATTADKLLAIIRYKTEKIGELETDNTLLEVCKRLPSPIYGNVTQQLEK